MKNRLPILLIALCGCVSTPHTASINKADIDRPPAVPNHLEPPVVVRVTNNVPAPPGVSSQVVLELPQAIERRQVPPLTIGWNAPAWGLPVTWNVYIRRDSTNWSFLGSIAGTNTAVNFTNYVAPLAFSVSGVDASGKEWPGIELDWGCPTNGKIFGSKFYWISVSNVVYVLSNAPLTTGPWTRSTVVSNQSGLRSVPLPSTTGRISLGIEK